MNTKAIILITSSIALFITQCSNTPTQTTTQPDNETKQFGNLTSDVLIDLPASISLEPSSAVLSKKTVSTDKTYGIYDGIRAYIGLADNLVNNEEYGVKAMITFWRDTINWQYIREVGSFSGTENNYTWTASYDPSIELAYRLIVTRDDITPNPVVLKIDFNGRFLLPKGRVYYNVGQIENSQDDSLEIEVTFDKQITSRSLSVAVTGCTMNDIDDPVNLDLSLYEYNDLIQISGSSYHPGIDSVLEGVTGHCYTFIGVADPVADKSIIRLGLPPSSYNNNDQTLFTTYGIAEMWTSAVIRQEIPKMTDTLKSLMASSYMNNMTLEAIIAKVTAGDTSVLFPASTTDTITVEQFKQFLTLNQNISNPVLRAQINSLLWIADLTQPVYFNYVGYAGNGNSVPSGFSYLNDVIIELDPITPSAVASLTIAP